MGQIGKYFVKKDTDGIAIKDNIVQGKKYRFTILSDRLIRLEYSQKGLFEDNTTQRIINRKFMKVNFTVTKTDTLLQISSSYFTLNYVMEKSFKSSKLTPGNTLKVVLNQTDKYWYYGHPEVRNFGGIPYSLDDFNGSLKLDKGLYSTDGFAIIDDSTSLVLNENGDFSKRNTNDIDIYLFMYRKDLGLCLQDYYNLTGYPMLPPRYAFGTWWSKNDKYTNKSIEELLINFSELNIPLSGILLGNKWHDERDPLSFDESVIKLNSLIPILNHYNSNIGITITPSLPVLENTITYQNISNANSDVKEKQYSFLPMDNKNINLYSTYGIRNYIMQGINSIYIDYNNNKDKESLSLINHYTHAMYSILLNKRSFILTRNHNYGIHRSGIVYTGKTNVNWNTLSILPKYYLTASNNGISYIATPIGGYYGGIETFELYIRYIQLGVFSTIFIIASDKGKYYKREPWRWNISEQEIIKKYLRLRYMLIPYIYTEGYIYHKLGSPIIQPLYYKYPKIYDEPLYKNQYFFGSKMLVCPITKKKNIVMNRVVQRMFIPEGVWYELESGKKYLGNKYYMSFYKDENYPVFVRSGSIIPISLDNTTNLPVNMELLVFPGASSNYQLYEDDGISNNYNNAVYSITDINYQYELNKYILEISSSTYPGLLPQERHYKVRFKNTKMSNITILNNNSPINGKIYVEQNDLIVEVAGIKTSSNLKIECLNDGMLENSMEKLINDDIKEILEDLEIETILKEKIDEIIFSNLSIRKKRIALRKLKRAKLEPKYIKIFLNLLEYIKTV